MDTKSKTLNNNPSQNYGISQAEMYQMYAYAKKYSTEDICLIYPYYDSIKELNGMSFTAAEIEDSEVRVSVFLIDLNDYMNSIMRIYEYYHLESCN